jgi:hypothetical protein
LLQPARSRRTARSAALASAVVSLSLALSLAACHKDQTRGVDGKPEAPDTIDFGLVPVNGRFVRALPVSNTGAIALTLQDSRTDEPFGVSALPETPVDPGSTADVTLSFSPIAPGEVNGTVTVFSNSIVAPAVDVKVHGIAYQPDLSVSPTRLDFGSLDVGKSTSLTFQITNLAPVPLVPEVEPTELRSDFNSAPTGYLDVLAGGASTTITVSFAPSRAGQQTTVLTVGCAQCPVKQLELTGNGLAIIPPPPPDAGTPDSGPADSGPADSGTPDAGPPDSGPEPECALVATPLDVDFGSLKPNQSARQTVVYKNQGTGPCFVQKPYLAPGSDLSFSLDTPSAFTLQPSDTRALVARFDPTAVTPPAPTGQLLAVSNDKTGPLVVPLHAVTLPADPPPPPPAQLKVTPLNLIFSAETPNAPASQEVLVQNVGGVALTFSSKSDDSKVTFTGGSGSLAPGDSATLAISVAGQVTAGHRVSHVTVDAAAAGKAVVNCDITNTTTPPPPAPAKLVVAPLALSFSAEINTTPPSQSLTASNTGGLGLSWTGTSDDPALTIAPTSGSLAAGGSAQIRVSVATQATTGTRVQTLTFDGGSAGTVLVKVTIEFHQTKPPPPPPQYGASVWPKFHHDNGNTGLSAIDTSKTKGVVAHKTFLSKPVKCQLLFGFWRCGTYQASPSLAADGTVYQVGGDGNVHAVDPNTGKEKWNVAIGEPMLASAESDITVVKSGHFFVHAHGGGGTTPQFFKILDKTTSGEITWKNTPAGLDSNGKRLDGFDSAPAIDYDGDLYLMNEDAKKIGQWDQRAVKLADSSLGSVSVNAFSHGAALTTDKISFWSGSGMLWAVDAKTDKLLWSAQDPAVTGTLLAFSKSSPMITSDGVLINSFGWREGTTTATYKYYTRITAWKAGPTKTQLWTKLIGPTSVGPGAIKPLDSHVNPEEEIRYNLGTSSVAQGPDGTLYVGHADGLYALDPKNKGATKWGIGTGPVVSSPAVGADGRVYFGSMDGNLYAVKAGAIVWQVKTGGQVNSSPAIGADGSIFAMSDDGSMYIVK